MTPLEEAEELLSSVGAPLAKGLLRSAIHAAKEGDLSDLEDALRYARGVAARERADSEAAEAARHRALVAFASGKNPAALAREHAKLRSKQDSDYRKWGQRRPDERTARKAHLSNRLDGRAHDMALLAAAYKLLTGEEIPTVSTRAKG